VQAVERFIVVTVTTRLARLRFPLRCGFASGRTSEDATRLETAVDVPTAAIRKLFAKTRRNVQR
jgi:hypothetical protein